MILTDFFEAGLSFSLHTWLQKNIATYAHYFVINSWHAATEVATILFATYYIASRSATLQKLHAHEHGRRSQWKATALSLLPRR